MKQENREKMMRGEYAKMNDRKNESIEDVPIWDKPYRAKGCQERNPAFECFLKYRNAGAKRSLIALSTSENINYQKICDWSSKYKWNERIDAMLLYENEEKKKANEDIKKKAIDMIKKRLETKNELIDAIFDVLKENVKRYAGTELTFKEFVSLMNLAMKVESLNIEDMSNINEVEQIFTENGIDAQNIQALINNFNVVLTSENNAAIEKYEDMMQDDNY